MLFENLILLLQLHDRKTITDITYHALLSETTPDSYHYFKEISKFRNGINFILQKTLRSLKTKEKIKIKILPKELLFFIIYRILWEKSDPNKVVKEVIKQAKNDLIRIKKRTPINKEFNQIWSYQNVLIQFSQKVHTFSWEISLKGKTEEEKISLKMGGPTFFINILKKVMELEEINENLKTMNNHNTKGVSFFRFNLRKLQGSEKPNKLEGSIESEEYTQDSIISDLKKQGISFKKDSDIPNLFSLKTSEKSKITKTKWFMKDYIVFQDKSSVAAVYMLGVKQGDVILDACAAPGMKTHLIHEQTLNRPTIIACDINPTRVENMNKSLQRISNTKDIILNSDSINLPLNKKVKFDKIIVDAPCTGSGTFADNPELKWRQNYKFLNRNVMLQKKILEQAYSYLKDGGTLVYSTCSLYPEEGEMQVAKYLQDAEKLEMPNWMGKPYKLKTDDKIIELNNCARFYPNKHGTKGFFIAKIKKKYRNLVDIPK